MVEAVERDQPRLPNRSNGSPSVGSEDRAPHEQENITLLVPEPGPSVVCRRVKPFDLPMFARGLQVRHFDQPDSFANRNGVMATAVATMRPFDRWRPVTHVALLPGEGLQGFVQFRQELPDRRWILTALGTGDDCRDGLRVCTDLIEFSVSRAGSRGVKRLFARVPTESSDRAALASVGFEPYMTESVMRLGNADLRRSASDHSIRIQDQADTWAVHQLYHGSAPKHVQFAEAWTSARWDVGKGMRSTPFWRAFVLEDGFQLVAWARIRRSGNVAAMEFMFLPDRVDVLEGFVGNVLSRVRQEAGVRQVFVAVRAHQAELQSTLLRSGFQDVGTQDLMIKYTTAKAVAKSVEFVPMPASEVMDRVPKRVPTYLNGSAREEST